MADTVVFTNLDALTNNGGGDYTVNSTNDDIAPFTVTFNGSLTPGDTFSYTDGNGASFTGTYDGTNADGDLIFNISSVSWPAPLSRRPRGSGRSKRCRSAIGSSPLRAKPNRSSGSVPGGCACNPGA